MANAGGAWDNAKKSHRGRAQGRHRLHRQGLGPAQGGRRRRHGRRSAQGHGRAGPQPDDQGDEHRQPARGAHHRQVQQDDAGPGVWSWPSCSPRPSGPSGRASARPRRLFVEIKDEASEVI
ncbi:MAG: sodium/proton-translocating pyrophosphatase [Ignavibacteriales bacterium]|nr:sodium/proton-translocating pyrophosphatase [Ignavibacteriales bacterium]